VIQSAVQLLELGFRHVLLGPVEGSPDVFDVRIGFLLGKADRALRSRFPSERKAQNQFLGEEETVVCY
jgi:hypothetical protein